MSGGEGVWVSVCVCVCERETYTQYRGNVGLFKGFRSENLSTVLLCVSLIFPEVSVV